MAGAPLAGGEEAVVWGLGSEKAWISG